MLKPRKKKKKKKKKKLFTSKKHDNTKFINARREKNALAKSNPIIAQKPTTSSPTSQKQSPPSSSPKKKRNVSPPQLDHAFISKLKSKSSPTHIILPPKNEPCTGQTLDMLDTKISSPKLRDAIAKGFVFEAGISRMIMHDNYYQIAAFNTRNLLATTPP
jgi:hypothetical protein